MANQWRQLVAALADPYRRQVYSELVLGLPGMPTARRARAIAALTSAGLLGPEGTVVDEAFTRLLADSPAVTRSGVDRWVRDGRIHQYPAKPADRLELLRWAAAHVPTGADLTERETNDLLAGMAQDVATLRRYLVDAGLLVRTADGATYRSAAGHEGSGGN